MCGANCSLHSLNCSHLRREQLRSPGNSPGQGTSSFPGPPRQIHPGAGVNTVYLRTSNWLKGEYILEMRSRLKESWNAEQLKQMMVRKGSSDSRFHIWKPWTAISIRNIILVLFSTSLPLVSLLYKYTHVMVEQSETLAVIPQHLTFIIQVTTQNSYEL